MSNKRPPAEKKFIKMDYPSNNHKVRKEGDTENVMEYRTEEKR